MAVVKKGSLPEVTKLRDLRGKKACFAGVGTQAGWVIPIDIVSVQYCIKYYCTLRGCRFSFVVFYFYYCKLEVTILCNCDR